MQPAPDKDDAESLFDFLDGDQSNRADKSDDNIGDDSNSGRRRRVASASDNNAEKPFPIIRKPVSVSETGPLKAPRPGDPVEPPPALTDSIRPPDTTRIRETPTKPKRVAQQAEPDMSELDLDELDLDFGAEEWPSSDNWADKSYRPVPVNYQPAQTSLARKAGYVLAFGLIACGAGYALIGVPVVKQWTDSAIASVNPAIANIKETISGLSGDEQQSATLSTDTALDPVVETVDAPAVDNTLAAADSNAPKTLNELFREQLAQLEALMQSGSLDAAEQAIEDMDRSVYGYGAPEFTEIKERIAGLRQGDIVELDSAPLSRNTLEEEPLTEQQRIQQEASQLEQEELARAERQAEEAAQAELAQQQQLAAELAAEQERAAAKALREESERVEQQRVAQENERARVQQAELERAAAEAAQIRADRIAQEQARQEQLTLALQERAQRVQLDQQEPPEQSAAADTYNPDDWQAVTPSGSNNDSVQQLAARQREAARQQRLIEARQREEQTAGSQPPSAVASDTVVALAEPEPVPLPQPVAENSGPTPITDADLQQVYGQFAQLQNAIESRDINAVIALTQRSGARIQQVMQMFENNVAITARLRNVSTLDAAGEIQGTLQITRLERADGAVTGPPQNLSSVRLSSVRDGDGWSAIGW